MPASTGVHHAASIDEMLGDRSTRFFAEGYKKITRTVSDVAVNGDGCRATAALNYPADWSRKGTVDLRPHLSTIDALVLAVAAAEAHLAHAGGLDPGQRARAWLRSFTMKAGRNPHEDLSAFPVLARPAGRVTAHASAAQTVSAYECEVGAIRVGLEIEHEPGAGAGSGTVPERRFADLAAAVGGGPRGYLDRMMRSTHSLSEVTVAPRHISAVVEVAAEGDGEAGNGLAPTGFAAAYEPSLSAVDCLVCMAQLAQSVMYSLDRIERRESETLWMRTVWFESARPRQPVQGPFIALLEVTKSRLLPYDGALWRIVDVAGDFHGLRVGSSLAHRLPQRDLRSVSVPATATATATASAVARGGA
jgi:hypothetical protein